MRVSALRKSVRSTSRAAPVPPCCTTPGLASQLRRHRSRLRMTRTRQPLDVVAGDSRKSSSAGRIAQVSGAASVSLTPPRASNSTQRLEGSGNSRVSTAMAPPNGSSFSRSRSRASRPALCAVAVAVAGLLNSSRSVRSSDRPDLPRTIRRPRFVTDLHSYRRRSTHRMHRRRSVTRKRIIVLFDMYGVIS